MPEWLKGTDCKSVGYAYAGSKPALSTKPACLQSSVVCDFYYTSLCKNLYSARMKQIPLNLLTLYADLTQALALSGGRGGTLASKTVGGQKHLYEVRRVGTTYTQNYIGPADRDDVKAAAARIKRTANEAKARKSTVSALKRARVPAPDPYMGRLLEVLSEQGLFERGVVLVGTGAYQLYPCIAGAFLSAGLMTKDVDLAIPYGVSFAGADPVPMEQILRRADPTFEARMNRDHKWAQVFVASSGFQVDLLTTPRRTKQPLHVKALSAAAVPLQFLDYLVAEPIEVVALYGAGVPVRVPAPERYAIHKLIVAEVRRATSVKAPKDLSQANDLLEALILRDPDVIVDAIADARSRGPKWRKLVDAGLKKIGRGLDGERL